MTESMTAVPPPIILIVDDKIDMLLGLGAFLESHGYSVKYTHSGEEALQFLKLIQPDLILLDLFMPDMDGLQVCERIKGHLNYQDIPILFLTASRDEEHLISAFEIGAVDYVMKPFMNAEVLARVTTHIKLRQQTRELQLAKEKLNTIITYIQDGLLVIDQEGIIQFVNPAASHMFNQPSSELLGHHLGRPILTGKTTLIEIVRLNDELGKAEITSADAQWEGKSASIVCLRDISDRRDVTLI